MFAIAKRNHLLVVDLSLNQLEIAQMVDLTFLVLLLQKTFTINNFDNIHAHTGKITTLFYK